MTSGLGVTMLSSEEMEIIDVRAGRERRRSDLIVDADERRRSRLRENSWSGGGALVMSPLLRYS